jgi:hypothetical protein
VTGDDDRSALAVKDPAQAGDVVAREVSGNCGAVTVNPAACSGSITAAQLEPSAQAPWTSTTLGFSLMPTIVSGELAPSLESTDSL